MRTPGPWLETVISKVTSVPCVAAAGTGLDHTHIGRVTGEAGGGESVLLLGSGSGSLPVTVRC